MSLDQTGPPPTADATTRIETPTGTPTTTATTTPWSTGATPPAAS